MAFDGLGAAAVERGATLDGALLVTAALVAGALVAGAVVLALIDVCFAEADVEPDVGLVDDGLVERDDTDDDAALDTGATLDTDDAPSSDDPHALAPSVRASTAPAAPPARPHDVVLLTHLALRFISSPLLSSLPARGSPSS